MLRVTFFISDFLYFWGGTVIAYIVCACVFESITEAGVFCFGVYVSMYPCKVRPGGSEPCLSVIYKRDEKLRDGTRVFVSISEKSDGEAEALRHQI